MLRAQIYSELDFSKPWFADLKYNNGSVGMKYSLFIAVANCQQLQMKYIPPLFMRFNFKRLEITPGKIGVVRVGGVISVSYFVVSACQN